MIEINKKNKKQLSLLIKFLGVETGRAEKIEGRNKKQKFGKANVKLQNQKYRFASNQNGNF